MLFVHIVTLIFLVILLVLQVNTEVEKKYINVLHAEFSKFDLKVEAQADILYSVRSFFIVNEGVNKEEWDFFLHSHNISHRYPNVGDLSYIEMIKSSNIVDKSAYKNLSNNEDHYVVKYSTLDESIIGTDVGSDQERYLTIKRAIEQNQIIITGPVTSFIDAPRKLILYLPIYENDFNDNGEIQYRTENVKGIVALSMYMDDFMAEIFDDYLLENFEIRVRNRDTNEEIYANSIDFTSAMRPLSEKVTVKVGGNFWEINVRINYFFFVDTSTKVVFVVIIFGGILINLSIYSMLRKFRNMLLICMENAKANPLSKK